MSFRFVNEGLNLEERDKITEAILCYEKGLRSLDAGIAISTDGAHCTGIYWEKAKGFKEKMKEARAQLVSRLDDLQGIQSNGEADEEQSEANKSASPVVWEDVSSLVSIEEGVNLFHVDAKGEVSTWSLPCDLKIFQILSETIANAPAAFLQCGEWLFPMNPGQSPVLKTADRTYMFPDVTLHDNQTVAKEGESMLSAVGILLSDLVDAATVARFERVLSCYSVLKEAPVPSTKPPRPPPPSVLSRRKSEQEATSIAVVPSAPEQVILVEPPETIIATPAEKNWSEKVSDGIIIGSHWISWGLDKGAVYAGEMMQKGAHQLRRRIKPNEVPTKVDPDISSNIRKVKTATGAAVQVTGVLVMALANLAAETGKHLAPMVREQGAKLVPAKYKAELGNEDGQKSMENVMKVAGAGVVGLSIMFVTLEHAGKLLLNSLSKASVDTVQHKYGHEAGDVTSDAFASAGNAVMTIWNVKHIGPKAIAKRTAAQTAKSLIMQENERIEMEKEAEIEALKQR